MHIIILRLIYIHSELLHVSFSHVTIFSDIKRKVPTDRLNCVFYIIRCSHDWPKHVVVHFAYKLILRYLRILLVQLLNLISWLFLKITVMFSVFARLTFSQRDCWRFWSSGVCRYVAQYMVPDICKHICVFKLRFFEIQKKYAIPHI